MLSSSRRRHLHTLISCAVAASGAFAALARRAGADEPPLRIAVAPFDGTALPYYAEAMGFYKKVGVTVDLTSFSSNGSVIAAAVAGGSIDIGSSNLVSLATGHLRNVPFTIVAPSGLFRLSSPTSMLMVPKSSPLRTAKDLSGKTIAVNALRTMSQFAPMAWIDENGGDSSAVNFVEVATRDMLPGLVSGHVDAAVIEQPFLSADADALRPFANVYAAVGSSFLLSALFTTIAFARARTDLVRRFQTATLAAAHWANLHHAETAPILAKVAKIEPSVIESMPRAAFGERLDPALIQPVIDVTVKYDGGTAFPAADLIFR